MGRSRRPFKRCFVNTRFASVLLFYCLRGGLDRSSDESTTSTKRNLTSVKSTYTTLMKIIAIHHPLNIRHSQDFVTLLVLIIIPSLYSAAKIYHILDYVPVESISIRYLTTKLLQYKLELLLRTSRSRSTSIAHKYVEVNKCYFILWFFSHIIRIIYVFYSKS